MVRSAPVGWCSRYCIAGPVVVVFPARAGSGEAALLGDFHLDELALVDGQLDGAETHTGYGMADEIEGIGVGGLGLAAGPIVGSLKHANIPVGRWRVKSRHASQHILYLFGWQLPFAEVFV